MYRVPLHNFSLLISYLDSHVYDVILYSLSNFIPLEPFYRYGRLVLWLGESGCQFLALRRHPFTIQPIEMERRFINIADQERYPITAYTNMSGKKQTASNTYWRPLAVFISLY